MKLLRVALIAACAVIGGSAQAAPLGSSTPVGDMQAVGLPVTGGTLSGPLSEKVVTIAADDTTPDVSGGNIFYTSANTGATAITDLDNPTVGQTVRICGGSNTNSSTIAASGNFSMPLGAITLALDTCVAFLVQADNDYIEVSRNVGTFSVSSFTAGAGSYTWTKPAGGCNFASIVLIPAGGSGGAGAYGTSDSGGGGGGPGVLAWETLRCSDLGATETVTLGASAGTTAGRGTNGTGATGGNPGSTSFGTWMVADPTAALSGAGGDTSAGAGGVQGVGGYTTATLLYATASFTGGVGDDTGPGLAGTSPQFATNGSISVPGVPFSVFAPAQGGGGGGLGDTTTPTAGGNGGATLSASGVALRTAAAGGSSNGQNGASCSGSGGWTTLTGAGNVVMWGGGFGGAGGAGGDNGTQDGGDGGAGCNCGGGGGGGGASESGTLSGDGGAGGAGCVLVVTW